MIEIMNAKVDNPNCEQLSAVYPPNGLCDILCHEDLNPAEQTIYDDAMAVMVNDCICKVDNTPYDLYLTRMTSSPINVVLDEITTSTLDYTTLSASDQGKLDALNQLIIDKSW